MTKEEKIIKQKDKTKDIERLINKLPFKLCYYSEVIIKAGLIEPTDIELPCFDKFLRKVEKCPDKAILQKVISYNVNRILDNDWKDGRGLIISYKFKYFRSAIVRGFKSTNINDDFIQSLYDFEEEN